MDKVLPTIIVVAVLAIVLFGMWQGWRGRKRRQAALPRLASVPTEVGTELITLDLFYVSTTVGGEPLNRIAVAGLGFRARASVTVAESGIVLALAGESEAFIPVGDIRDVDRANVTIDRVVENGGLVVIGWTLGETAVDSYLRVIDSADSARLIEAIRDVIGVSAGQRKKA